MCCKSAKDGKIFKKVQWLFVLVSVIGECIYRSQCPNWNVFEPVSFIINYKKKFVQLVTQKIEAFSLNLKTLPPFKATFAF